MICRNCNTLNDNENKKCVRCGTKMEKSAAAPGGQKYYSNRKRGKIAAGKGPKQAGRNRRIIALALLLVAFIYYLYDMENIQQYWQGNKLIQHYYSLSMKFINPEYKQPAATGTLVTQVDKLEIGVPEKDKLVLKKKKREPEPEFDYYAIMKKEKKKGVEKKDTLIYQTQSDSKAAAELQKKNDRSSNKYYGKDNKVMVLVEAQNLEMGSDTGSELESPAHTVAVNSFYMDINEVTNAEFIRFLQKSGYKKVEDYRHFKDKRFNATRQPMVDVAYEDAMAYARWAGKRLPSEVEWECAARSGDGWLYPTGSSIDPSMAAIEGISGEGRTREVGSFKSNKYGIFDLAGNVEEWVAGVLSRYPGNNSINTSYGKIRITRGGNWKTGRGDLVSYRRSTLRISGATGRVGFRCVISASEVARQQQ